MKKQIELLQPSGNDVALEIKALKKFLDEKQYEVDARLFENIKSGDIIEVYAFPEHTQIFCNNEFMRLCSYSREQMTTIPFHHLFWRSEEDHFAVLKRAKQVMEKETHVVSWDLPSHDLVESLHPRRRTFEMSMGVITPIFEKGKPVGFISTVRVELIFQWAEDVDPAA